MHNHQPHPTPTPLVVQASGVRPVLKWAGGKGRLLEQLLPRLPADVRRRRFIEPFAGGLALFFALEPEAALIGDANPALVCTYRALARAPEDVIQELERLAELYEVDAHRTYYGVRDFYNDPIFWGSFFDDAERAAAFIFLNRTGFNGLHRVNRKGAFNVPLGSRKKREAIVDRMRILRASTVLRRALVLEADFAELCALAAPGDVVYLDPPYDTGEAGAGFTAYAGAFTWEDQRRVASTFYELAARGVHVLASNAATPRIRDLYAGASMVEIMAPRTIAPKGADRVQAREILTWAAPRE